MQVTDPKEWLIHPGEVHGGTPQAGQTSLRSSWCSGQSRVVALRHDDFQAGSAAKQWGQNRERQRPDSVPEIGNPCGEAGRDEAERDHACGASTPKIAVTLSRSTFSKEFGREGRDRPSASRRIPAGVSPYRKAVRQSQLSNGSSVRG